MNGTDIPSKDSLSVLGVSTSREVSLAEHVKSIAQQAARKLGYLFRARELLFSRISPDDL